MSYIEENLTSGEVVLYRTRLHWIVLIGPCTFGALIAVVALSLIAGSFFDKSGSGVGLFGLVLLLVSAVLVGVGILRRSSTEMAVTNRRVMVKVGLLSRRTTEIMLQKVESVAVDQSIWGRILNFGSIVVRGTGGTPESFARISHPLEFRRQVQQQLDKMQPLAMSASV